jgi:peptide/nickel transport system permease protein
VRSFKGISRFSRHRLALVGFILTCVLILTAILAPYIAPRSYTDMNLSRIRQGISADYPLGTDEFGRCILSRIIWGCRVSLKVGLVVVLIGGIIGSIMGLVAGYFGKMVDQLISRVIDILLTFPYILLAIAFVSILGKGGLEQCMIAIGLANVSRFARLIRSYAISIREMEYIQAVRALGGSHWRIIFHHIMPNCISGILIYATLTMGMSILAEAALSFLGLGIQPPEPSWGTMISTGKNYIRVAPHMSLFPGLAITITVMGFNFLGDGLRDYLDPRFQKSNKSQA